MTAPTTPGDELDLAAAAATLRRAIRSGGAQLDPEALARAERVGARVDERTSLAGEHTVVALAGATGSGKSSVFNALVGADIATVGARRPTTSQATGAHWGPVSPAGLLDWLRVPTRHLVAGGEASDLDGVVLLDLPDIDSTVAAHRAEAERILELVDVFVWVTDPEKYADALLHNDFLARSAQHARLTVVVLNQSDRLSHDATRRCVDDLRRLLARDGMTDTMVLATSARTGRGIAPLREVLAEQAHGHRAARLRLAADVGAAAATLRRGVADTEPALPEAAGADLVNALSRAAGIPVVLEAVRRDYRREAATRSGWLFARWGHRLRPDPLRRLRLRADTPGDPGDGLGGGLDRELSAVLGRSSIPPPSPATVSAVALATHQLGDTLSDGLPPRWAQAVQEAAAPPLADLGDALDQAVMRTPLRADEPPPWWGLANLLQWLCGLAALAGLGWLIVLSVVGWLQLPVPSAPTVGPLPLPFVLLAGGLLGGWLVSLATRPIAVWGAVRRRRHVEARLHEAIREVADERVLAPVADIVRRHRDTRELLDTTAGLADAGAPGEAGW